MAETPTVTDPGGDGEGGRGEGGSKSSWGRIARIGLVLAVVLELFVLIRGGSDDPEPGSGSGGGEAASEAAIVETRGDTAVAYSACARLVNEELKSGGTAYFPVAGAEPEMTEGTGGGDGLLYRFRSRARLQLESGDVLWYTFDCSVERRDDRWRRRELRIRRLR